MISNLTGKAISANLAVLALLAALVAPQDAQAHEEVSFVFHSISWGMTRGQRARVSVLNPNEPSDQGLAFVQVKLFDASGAVIAASDEISIPSGQVRSVDFRRANLPASDQIGERVQTRAEVHYRSFLLVDRTKVVIFIEVIDDASGRSSLVVSQTPNSPVTGPALTELAVVVYSARALSALARGQRLRVNAVYPGHLTDPQPPAALRARVRLFDANGGLLGQSGEATLVPNQIHSVDFDRADIAAVGEPSGGRLQIRVSVEVAPTAPYSFTQDPRPTGLFPISLELIDNNTGNTLAVWVTTGFFEVSQ